MGDEQTVVLVLDDETMVRDNIEAFLEDEGFTALSAATGENALEILAERPVSACVVDMRLPGMSGNDFILLAHRIRPETLFLVHTGSTNYVIPPELARLGLTRDLVFIKPLKDMGVLAKAIRERLG